MALEFVRNRLYDAIDGLGLGREKMLRRALLTSRRHINVYKPGDVVRLKHRRWKKLPDRKLAGAEAETAWQASWMARGGVRMSQPLHAIDATVSAHR